MNQYEFPSDSSTSSIDDRPPSIRAEQSLKMTLIVASVCLVGVSASLWRSVSHSVAASATRDEQWQELYREVVGGLNDLTNAVHLSTSSELSSVVFRFRSESYCGPPQGDSFVSITSQNNKELRRTGNIDSYCDFGLLPYGPYRLTANFSIYRLDWDFNIHPGAPVDRVVVVPSAVPYSNVEIEIQRDSQSDRPPGVCVIRARPRTEGDWTWQATNPVAIVASTEISDAGVSQLMHTDPVLQALVETYHVEILSRVPFLESDVLSVHCLSSVDDPSAISRNTFSRFVCYVDEKIAIELLPDSAMSALSNFHYQLLQPQTLRWGMNNNQATLTVFIRPQDSAVSSDSEDGDRSFENQTKSQTHQF